MGRNTYEEMAEFCPTSDDEYAEPMNTIPKAVFSTSLERASWPETRIARGDLTEEIAQLKQDATGNLIAWGGASFAQSLTRLGLVDEYRLVLHPVALGEWLIDPDGYRIELVRWPHGHPDGITAADFA